MPFVRGEGPYALIICPARELARQIHEVVDGMAKSLHEAGEPKINTLLCMGGVDLGEQV